VGTDFLEIEQRGIGRSFYDGVELSVRLDAGVGGGDVVVEEGFVGVEVAVEGVKGFREDGAGEGESFAVDGLGGDRGASKSKFLLIQSAK
jgi:hypothetical protein